jgi:electron transport complex protein RnfG
MRDVIKLGGILMAVCIIAAAALAGVNQLTGDKIAEQRQLKLENTIAGFFEGADGIEDITDEVKGTLGAHLDEFAVQGVYRAVKSGSDLGIAIKVTPSGYGGVIEALVGIGRDGVVAGIGIISNQETPGLGAKVASEGFIGQFRGKSGESDFRVKKDGGEILPITGATISSRAVSRGVSSAVALFKEMDKRGLLL